MKYEELKNKQQEEFNNLPLMAAFNEEQFKEGMKKLKVKSRKELYSIGYGCFIRKADSKELFALLNKHHTELQEFVKDDTNLKEMFICEMGNHEYQLTFNDSEVIEACNLSWKDAQNDERIIKVFTEAKKEYLKLCVDNKWC